MRQVEANRCMYSRFRTILGKSNTGALSSLRIPASDTTDPDEYTRIYDPQEIESCLLHRNQEHFSQATGTPFTIPPLSLHIGRNAEHGVPGALTALCHATDEATIALLEEFVSYQLPEITCDISTDDVIGKFSRWKETTSTSPHGNHLGHYKALLVPNPLPPKTSESDCPDALT